jgi:hypothetical protein
MQTQCASLWHKKYTTCNLGGIGLERACHTRSLQQASQFDSFSASDNKLAKSVMRIELTARHLDNRLHIDSEFKF